MSGIIIRVESLSKLYKIGALKTRHDPLRDQLDRYKNFLSRIPFILPVSTGRDDG